MAFRPQTFANVEDPQELRRYLLELQQELARALGETNQLSPVVTSATYAANYDEIVRIDPPTGGTTVILPPPSIAKAGATVTLTVVGDGGQITLECVGGQVNNASSFTFQAGVGDVVCRLDGPRGWFIPSAELSGSGPADAQYYVGAADGSLPNARLGTASTEITPNHGAPNVVTWALNTASVVLAKLQDLTGLSVLGRAANSTGVMAAITASAARQTLTVNDAGTSLAWGYPVEVQERGSDVGDAYSLDVQSHNSITAHAEVSGGVATLEFLLAHNRTKRVNVTGVVDTSDWDEYDVIYFTGGTPVVNSIPQPLDPDGNPTGKRMILFVGLAVTQLTLTNNSGPLGDRFFLPGFVDAEAFRGDIIEIVYSTEVTSWVGAFSLAVAGRQTTGGTQLRGKEIVWDVGSAGGISVSLTKAAGQLRVVHALDDIPLTLLDDVADDTWIGNVSGGAAAPSANTLSSLAGNGFSYSEVGKDFNIGTGTKIGVTADAVTWLGMEGRIGGVDAGDFVGIDFTNAGGNVTFSPDTGAGGTFGVVANVDLSSVTYTDGDGLDLSGQEFSVDVSDLVGYGLSDDGSNNLRLGPFDLVNEGVAANEDDYARPNLERVLRLDPSADVALTGVASGYDGEILFVLKGGNSNYIDLPDESGSSTDGNRLQFADDQQRRLVKRDDVAPFVHFGGDWYHFGSPWPFYDDSTQTNRDIPIVNSAGEWGRENLTTAVDGAAPGRLLAYTEYNSGSGTHTFDSACARYYYRITGGGGGGGSCTNGAGASAGGGGGAGPTEEGFDTPPGASTSYTVGSGGSAGTSGGAGGAGTGSSFDSHSTNAGLGGLGGALTSTFTLTQGGGNISGNQGTAGSPGIASGTDSVAQGGNGAPGFFGGGAQGRVQSGTGNLAGSIGRRPGAGGSGSCQVGTASTPSGGAGAAGLVQVWEFT